MCWPDPNITVATRMKPGALFFITHLSAQEVDALLPEAYMAARLATLGQDRAEAEAKIALLNELLRARLEYAIAAVEKV